MLPVYAVLIAVVTASPSPVVELMTRQKAIVREAPSETARAVAELPPNIKVQSDERKDFWFHISARVGSTEVKGWVNQTDVTTIMGRSKGQLIEENDRLYKELVSLREAEARLEKDAGSAREAIRKAEEEIAELKRQLAQARAELAEARKTIERLEAARKPPDNAGD